MFEWLLLGTQIMLPPRTHRGWGRNANIFGVQSCHVQDVKVDGAKT